MDIGTLIVQHTLTVVPEYNGHGEHTGWKVFNPSTGKWTQSINLIQAVTKATEEK